MESAAGFARCLPMEDKPLEDNRPLEDIDSWFETSTQMASGDVAAFELFFETFHDRMLQVAHFATGRDESVCMDIVQEAMLKSMRSMRPIENRRRLEGFVQAVTRSVAYDWLRRETRQNRLLERRALEIEMQGHGATAEDAASQPSDGRERVATGEASGYLDDAVQMAWLESQLQALDPQLQQLIHWRYRLGWTLQRIAETVGLKPGAIDGRLRRAVERLRLRAEEEFDGE